MAAQIGTIERFATSMEDVRILVVEDQQEIGHILKLSIEQINRNYSVSVASDAFEAMDLLRKSPFDLVITDYMMPDMDGLELLESVRNLSPDTQVVVISALPSSIIRPLIKEADVEFFLPKPFTSKNISQIVGKALAKIESLRDKHKPDQAAISSKISGSVLHNQLNDLLRYTNATSCFLVDSTGHLIAQAGDNTQTPLTALASLIAANATAAMRISKLLDNPTPFQTTIYESTVHNVAVYMVDEGVFLVVVFNKKVKIGLIQHYARQTVAGLVDSLKASQKNG